MQHDYLGLELFITVWNLCKESYVTQFENMYDDIDLSGGLFDFDGGGPLMSQQAESMYVDDDMYVDDLYSTRSRAHVGMDELATGIEDSENLGYYERISVSDLFDQCIVPTLSQAFFSISPIAGLCLICRMSCLFCHIGEYCGNIFLYICSY